MLPKFLIADNSQEQPDKLYVVHTQNPRFIVEGNNEDFDEVQEIFWIDEPVTDENELESLMNEAMDFLDSELQNQEDLYDELDNNLLKN